MSADRVDHHKSSREKDGKRKRNRKHDDDSRDRSNRKRHDKSPKERSSKRDDKGGKEVSGRHRDDRDHSRKERDDGRRHKSSRNRDEDEVRNRKHDSLHKKDKKRKHDRDEDRRKHRSRDHEDDSDSRRQKRPKQSKSDGDKERVSQVKPSKVDKSVLVDMGEVLGHPPTKLLDAEKDYYAFHQHLWVYLVREEGLTFNDLQSTREARKAFGRFVEKYNSGELERAYYEPSPPSEALEECKTTRHNWSLRISEHEDQNLHVLQEGVRKQTEFKSSGLRGEKMDDTGAIAPVTLPASRNDEAPTRSSTAARQADRIAERRLREQVRVAEDEFSGGPKEGRERQIEKRKEVGEKIHAASRDRDDMVTLSDDVLYGDTDRSSFQEALHREKSRLHKKEEQRNSRLADLQQKEKEKQEAMFRLLGLQPRTDDKK